ncbi:MAG: HAD family phosphatase [Rhodobacteraceae bacterium]|nr:HAD family phosphatase [Paracoccaceae bacterium]
MSATGQPSLVIFDCDGVLVDSESLTAVVVADHLTRIGWPITPEETMTAFIGGTLERIRRQAQERVGAVPVDWAQGVYADIFKALETVEKLPGVDAALDALDAAGIPYCIGSNGPHKKMAVSLPATGLDIRFGGLTPGVDGGRIFSAHDYADGKPSPEMFLDAARRFGVAPEHTVVVGDSRNDALAARAAGMRCLGLATELEPSAFAELGAEPFGHMADVPGLLSLQ